MATTDPSYQNLYSGLMTLDPETGEIPKTRMSDATQTRDMIVRAIRYDMQVRDYRRARVKGLVQGNPPFSTQALIDAGRGDECNVNWRHAKSYLDLARGLVYDTFSEADTYTTVELDSWHKEAKQLDQSAFVDWSHIVTDEFDRLQKRDNRWDYATQLSQGQMVLYGTGPLVFEDEYDWRCESFECKTLLLPEWTRSTTEKWEWAALIVEYSPDRLYARIANAEAAQRRGWNVAATRRAIMNAHPLTRTGVLFQNWSWHEDLLKNGTYYYADQSKIIRAAHFYFREFPDDGEEMGRITETMIDLDALSSTSKDGAVEYLFKSPKRYGSWEEIIHPMYWNHDVNGYSHSVTGLGVEMFGALEYYNRLFCRLADNAMAPTMFFKPTTASERERMSIAQMGRYAILPAALDYVQMHIQPLLQDGMAMSREVQGQLQSNIAQFRSQAMSRQQGNPATATQINYEASEQAKMGKTQLSRIYEQYDWLYREKFRRATNPKLTNSIRGGAAALEFVRRCELRGVPREALQCVGSVTAARVVGQGSAFVRQQALEFLIGLVGMLPEPGRENLIRDVVASRAGQAKVDRYAMRGTTPAPQIQQQQSDAQQQVASMKIGVPPLPTPFQNPMVYAGSFIMAAENALRALQQGADPHETVAFNDLAIPAAQTHLQRLAQDPSRRGQLKQFTERLSQVQSGTDEVKGQLQQADQKRQQAAAQMQGLQNGSDPDLQVGMAKVQARHQVDMTKAAARHQLDSQKTAAQLGLQQQKQNAELGLAAQRQHAETVLDDALTAHGMRLDAAKAQHGMTIDAVTAHHDVAATHAATAHDMHVKQATAEHAAALAAAETAARVANQKAAANKPGANGKGKKA